MAKKRDDAPDLETINETESLRNQNNQMLDMLVEMREEMDALKASQGQPVAVVSANPEMAELDAELQALKAEFADYPAIEMIERRVLVGADANNEIRLQDEPDVVHDPDGSMRKWKLRWFNFEKSGRAEQAQREGYVKVPWVELRQDESVAGAEKKDEWVRQGHQGLQVLCKMPMKLYDYKKRRDAARLGGVLTSESKLRDHLAGSVANMAGKGGDNADQAGSFIHNPKFQLEIKKGEVERVTA